MQLLMAHRKRQNHVEIILEVMFQHRSRKCFFSLRSLPAPVCSVLKLAENCSASRAYGLDSVILKSNYSDAKKSIGGIWQARRYE
jgi:hypothetical protein